MQLDLFVTTPASASAASAPALFASTPASPLIGLQVKLDSACQCGTNTATIGSSGGPHAARLKCEGCSCHRGWISHAAASWLETVQARFGVPTTITIRRRARDA
jgi:hypothetical protein